MTLTELKDVVRTIRRLIPANSRWVVQVNYYEDRSLEDYLDSYWPEDLTPAPKVYKLTATELAKEAWKGFKESYRKYPDCTNLPSKLDDVTYFVTYAYVGDGEWANAGAIPFKEWRKQVEERERQRAESLAAGICSQYNVKANTVEFVRAVKRAFKRLIESEKRYREDSEVRMERYGAYDNKENFWKDNDYSSSVQHGHERNLRCVLQYLHKYCPLLMARYRELQLRRRRVNREG